MYAPMSVPLLGLVAGIIVGISGGGTGCFIICACLACVLCLVTIAMSRDPVKGFARNRYHFVWIFLAFTAAGILTYDVNRPLSLSGNLDYYYAADGRITEISRSTSGDIALISVRRLILSDSTVLKTDNLTIRLDSDALEAVIDDNVIFPLQLEMIADSPNHFGHGFADRMNSRGIYYVTRSPADKVEVYGHTYTLAGLAHVVRDRIESSMEKAPIARDARNFLITILVGDRAYLDRDIRDLFSDAGISHILALSGMHVAIISGLLLWLLFPINFLGYYRQRLLIAVILILFYTFITGWQPSTLRAVIMMASVSACTFLERKNSAWNSLALASFVILLFRPLSLLDIGMQLSFACVASLIFFVNPLNPFKCHDHPVFYRISAAILTSLAATLGTWCISARYFGSVPVAFLPVNILVLPVLPIYLALALVYFVLHACGLAPQILGSLLEYGYKLLTELVSTLTSGGDSAIDFTPSTLAVALWIMSAAALAVYLHGHRGKMMKAVCSLLAATFVVSACFPADADESDGFIIQSGMSPVRMQIRMSGKEKSVTFPPEATSVCNVAGVTVMVMDETPDSMAISNMPRCDILILASGFKGNIADLTDIRYSQIGIHNSVRRTREKEMIAEADSLGMKCHSIRIDGPLRVMSQ